MDKKIFISYSYKDKIFVEWLKSNLTELGFEFWYDQQEINVGDRSQEKINEGIQSSSAFILVLSSSSMNSDWVKYEMNSALLLNAVKKGITILPIKIDNSNIPSDLSGYPYADFSIDQKQGLEILKRSLLKANTKLDYEFTDWSNFNGKSFEDLIFELLINEEEFSNVIRTPPTRDGGYDFIATTQTIPGVPEKIIIESKFYKNQKISIDILRNLYAVASIANVNKILLITNSELTNSSRNFLTNTIPNIVVWEGHELIRRLLFHPTLVERYFLKNITKKEEPSEILDAELLNVQKLLKELDNCPEGWSGWKNYENICIKILSHLFVPTLEEPKIQSRRESGIDIRDAVFPNRSNDKNWRFVRDSYDARYVVFEFKNYSEEGSEIDKQVVIQIADYLKQTIGRFGIVCSKKTPNKSGIEKRKDIYIENQKLILFLSNENLKEMLLRKYKKMDPSDVIIDLIDDFNLKF
jgi:TIR domain./Restriction endonuclease.